MLDPWKNCFSLLFHENVMCLSVGLLRICQVFSVSCRLCIGELEQIAVSWVMYVLVILYLTLLSLYCWQNHYIDHTFMYRDVESVKVCIGARILPSVGPWLPVFKPVGLVTIHDHLFLPIWYYTTWSSWFIGVK